MSDIREAELQMIAALVQFIIMVTFIITTAGYAIIACVAVMSFFLTGGSITWGS